MTHFRAQYFLSAIAGSAALFMLRSYWLAIVSAGLALTLGYTMSGYYLSPPYPEGDAQIRILSANVLSTNTSHAAFLALVREHDPDIIFVLETTDAWVQALTALEDNYPSVTTIGRPDNFGIAAYSRLDETQFSVVTMSAASFPAISARLPLSGRQTQILAMHTAPPMGALNAELRNQHLQEASQFLAARPGPKILLGDFNISPWSPFFSDVLRLNNLRDARLGFGIKPTWPLFFFPAAIPIDHVLVSSHVAIANFQTSGNFGSDHRAVVVDIRVTPK